MLFRSPAASPELIASLVEASTPSACVPARQIRGDFAELGMKEWARAGRAGLIRVGETVELLVSILPPSCRLSDFK